MVGHIGPTKNRLAGIKKEKKTGNTKAPHISIFSTQTLYLDDRAQQDLLPDLKSIKSDSYPGPIKYVHLLLICKNLTPELLQYTLRSIYVCEALNESFEYIYRMFFNS